MVKKLTLIKTLTRAYATEGLPSRCSQLMICHGASATTHPPRITPNRSYVNMPKTLPSRQALLAIPELPHVLKTSPFGVTRSPRFSTSP